MAVDVVFGDVGCSFTPGGCSLTSATLDIPAIGVSLAFIGVSLGTAAAVAPVVPFVFDFSNVAQSQYIPLLAGFG